MESSSALKNIRSCALFTTISGQAMSNNWSCKAMPARVRAMASSARALAFVWLIWSPCVFAGAPDWLRTAAQTSLAHPAGDASEAVLLDEHITTVADSGEIKTLYRRASRILRPGSSHQKMVAVYFDSETR